MMEQTAQTRQLFAYDLWANRKIADTLSSSPEDAGGECQNLFAHIGAAQQTWYNRIIGKDTSRIELWPEGQPAGRTLMQLGQLHEYWLKVIESDDPDTLVSYQNSKGTSFETPLNGILHHVVIHGQHHRAQIATLLRQDGIRPPGTDYIFYLREN